MMAFFYSTKMTPDTFYSCDVAIIGGGLSGLWAGHLLTEHGFNVLVLEAHNRIGGRILTEHSPHSPFIDAGAQYISKGQDRICSLLKQWNIGTFPSYETGRVIYFLDRNRIVTEPTLKDPDETVSVAKVLNDMAELVPLQEPWKCPDAHEWDNLTLEEWLQKETQSKNARDQIMQSIEGVYRSCPGKTSLLGALFCIKSGDPLDAFLSQSEGPELRVEGGVEQLLHRIAKNISSQIILNARVDQIHYGECGAEILAGNLKVQAQNVIITTPPPIASRIYYFPSLPPMRDQLAQRTPLGWVTKVHCTYNEAFWRAEGLSGSVESDSGFAKICVDNSPSSGNPGMLLVFIQGPDVISFGGLTLAEKKRIITEELFTYFGSAAGDMIDFHEKSWIEDPFCRGCYGGYYSCGVWTKCGPALRESVGPIHWAGTETSAIWNGKMEGALLSAEAAVSKITKS